MKCEICKSEHKVRKYKKEIYLCSKHYTQMWKHGKILERTRFDDNKIIDCGEYYEIIIYNQKNEEIARTKFSKDQLNKIKQYKWRIVKGYVATTINNKTSKLHQLILGKKQGFITDHINHDKLDNRNENLRLVTYSQNQMNRKAIGVYWDKNRKKWVAKIKINYKQINLGGFTNKEDAIKARRKAEKKYFGEFSYKRTNLCIKN